MGDDSHIVTAARAIDARPSPRCWRSTPADRWAHADLLAENLLQQKGKLVAALDFGGLGVGDPTIDLHGAREVLNAPAREVFRKRLGGSDVQWLLGRAWALAIALGTFSYYWQTMPERVSDRLGMAQQVLADVRENP